MAATGTTLELQRADFITQAMGVLLRPLQAMIAAPDVVFLAALGLMLFHSPDFNFYSIDRIAFGLLIFIVFLRVCVLQLPLPIERRVTWPMLALVVLA